MKNRIIYTVVALASLLFASCDYVKPNDDFSPNSGQPAQDTSSCLSNPAPALSGSAFSTKTNTLISSFRKVLVEDYTGQKCGNCPPAAVTAENLENQYKDSVVVLAVHAGGFAVPFGAYTNDFRTPAGDEWDGPSGFNISGNGNPNGMVNRMGYPTTTHVKAYTNWGSLVSQLAPFNKNQGIKLNITTNYDTVQRLLNVDIKPVFLRNYGDTAINLSVVLSEDSIVGMQKDYSKSPPDVPNYVFMNLMRGSLNGSWGDALNKCPWYKRGFSVSGTFNDKHLNLIAFAFYATTKEIIQVEKIKLR